MKLTSRGEDGTASHVHVLASVWRVVLVDRRVRVRLGAHVQGGALVHHARHVDLRLSRLLLAPALAALLVVPVLELPALRARHDDDRVVRGLVHDRPELLVRRVEYHLQLDVRRRVGILAVRLDPRVLVVLVELA